MMLSAGNIAVFLLGLGCFLIPSGRAYEDCDYFKCINEHTFELTNGLRFECPTFPDKTVCNNKCIDVETSSTLLRQFTFIARGAKSPCVKVQELCPYECLNAFEFKINGLEYVCPEYHVCNEKHDSCTICLPGKCSNVNAYKCIDDHTVSIQGVSVPCGTGKVCNKEFKYPCDYCIDENRPALTTTTKRPENPTTNCYDGFGISLPCRYGPQGSYFRCRAQNGGFVQETKSCQLLGKDPVCKKYRLCD